MADLAIIAHWPLSEMAVVSLNELLGNTGYSLAQISELMGWHQNLVETHNRINGATEQ